MLGSCGEGVYIGAGFVAFSRFHLWLPMVAPMASMLVSYFASGAVRYACAQQLADVCFSGHVEHTAKYELFRSADAYLLPSYTEGLPISVLEAVAPEERKLSSGGRWSRVAVLALLLVAAGVSRRCC